MVHRIEWVVGPRALVRITFPEETSGSKRADARWTHFLHVDQRQDSFKDSHLWPVKPDQWEQGQRVSARRQVRRKPWAHHEETTAWQPVPAEFEGNRGFEPNDFMAMRICDGSGKTVGEHLGIVHSSRPKPKPKGATGGKPRYDMPKEIRI